MKPLVYCVTKHTIPGWVPFHEKLPLGFAYETSTHFVHFFGAKGGLWNIQSGLTVTQAKSGCLIDWINQTFGACKIEEGHHEVGHVVRGVWRPGLYYFDETLKGLSASTSDLRLAEQALSLLIQRLDELLLFIEPDPVTLKTHGHKTRELLILACTEVENNWTSYLHSTGSVPSRGGQFTTNDYVKLLMPLHLREYQVSLTRYGKMAPFRPFLNWSSEAPSKSLNWYDAYNKTKHDRNTYFSEATLENCIQAVAANLILFSVRFGPFHVVEGGGTLAVIFKQLFAIDLEDCSPSSFYVPAVELPSNQRTDLICFNGRELIQQRIVDQLVL